MQIIDIPDYVKRALNLLESSGYEAYIVGGAARDIILGDVPSDYDIASSATPDECLGVFEKAKIKTVDTSKKHGTIVVIIEGHQIEITTYRVDGDYADNRHPDMVTFTKSIEEDVARRDFTMNAIYINSNSELVDLFGGIKDIEAGIIRTCGEPDRRFEEDALRIMRALRFAAVLGFEIEEKTRASIFKNYKLLSGISKERIATEFIKLLKGKNASGVIREYLEVFGLFLPVLLKMKGFDQKTKYHDKDMLEHTLAVLDGIDPKTDELCMAALLHDVGKTEVFCVDKNGVGHMKNHNKYSMIIAEKFLSDLKFSNSFKKKVDNLIRLHDVFPQSEVQIRKFLAHSSVEFMRELSVLQRADINGHAPNHRERMAYVDLREKIIDKIIVEEQCINMRELAISGQDVIAAGIPEGPRVGEIMRHVFSKVLEGTLANEKEEIIRYIGDRFNGKGK